MVDPNGRVASVSVQVVPADKAAAFSPRADGSWPSLPNAIPVQMALDRSISTASGLVQVSLPTETGKAPRPCRVLIQTALRDSAGKTVYSPPRAVELPEKPGRILAGGKLDRYRKKLARKSLSRLGPLVEDEDPNTADACQLIRDDVQNKVTISMPGKLFTLSPRITSRSKKPLHNAPRVLADVEGDFLTYVQVSGDINPGIDPPTDPRGRKLPISFQGAGLLLYQDKNNFVRLERACQAEGAGLVCELLVEVVRGGREIEFHYIPLKGDPASPLDLLLIRRNGRVRCLFSADHKNITSFREFAIEYPDKVKIGLTASNLSKKPFSARFEDFLILTDQEKLDQDFGE